MPGVYAMITGCENHNFIDTSLDLVGLNEKYGGRYAVIIISTFREVVKILWIDHMTNIYGERYYVIKTLDGDSISTDYVAAVFDTEEEANLFKECY